MVRMPVLLGLGTAPGLGERTMRPRFPLGVPVVGARLGSARLGRRFFCVRLSAPCVLCAAAAAARPGAQFAPPRAIRARRPLRPFVAGVGEPPLPSAALPAARRQEGKGGGGSPGPLTMLGECRTRRMHGGHLRDTVMRRQTGGGRILTDPGSWVSILSKDPVDPGSCSHSFCGILWILEKLLLDPGFSS